MLQTYRLSYLLVQCKDIDRFILGKLLPKNVLMYKKNLMIKLNIKNDKWECEIDLSFIASDLRKIGNDQNIKAIYYPATYQYGNNQLMHKGAIFAFNTKKTILFYDPYGTYSKYGADYLEPMIRSLKAGSGIKVDKFHNKPEILKTQSIVLEKNNRRSSEYNNLVRLIEPDLDTKDNRVSIHDGKEYREQYDATYSTFKLLKKINPARIEIFGKFSSKICVTITIVETYHFFNNSLDEYYREISATNNPNEVIMKYLKKISDKFGIPNFKIESENYELCKNF